MRPPLALSLIISGACSADPGGLAGLELEDGGTGSRADASSPSELPWRALAGRFLGVFPSRSWITVLSSSEPLRHVPLTPPGTTRCVSYRSGIDLAREHLIVRWASNSTAETPECPEVVALHDPVSLAERPGKRVLLARAPAAAAQVSEAKLYVAQPARINAVDIGTMTVTSTIELDGLLDRFVTPTALLVTPDIAYVVGLDAERNAVVVAIDVATDSVIDLDDAQPGVQARRLGLRGLVQARLGGPRRMVVVGTGEGADPGGLVLVDLPSVQIARRITGAALGGTPRDADFLDEDTLVVAAGAVRLASARGGTVAPGALIAKSDSVLESGHFTVRVLPGKALFTVYNRRVRGTRDEDVLEVWSLAGARLQEIPFGVEHVVTSIELPAP
jgi:hypothetical protein